MDFKFRSMEERSSSYFSSSPNFSTQNVSNISYFTRQAIRAGFTSPDPIRREYSRNPNPNPNEMRESIQRELEKERIRAEIIAEEVYRRRILEDEVRRELMYERELALRRGEGEFGFRSSSMRFETRVPLLTNFEHRIGVSPHREVGFQGSNTLPFQRDPVIAGNVDGNGVSVGVRLKEIKEIKGSASEINNKDKIIFLAKPNTTELKRKATTPPIGATVDTCDVSKKPKSKDEWSCALCRVTATSKRALDDHLQGKKHKSRESGLCSQRTGFGTSPLPKMGSASAGKPVKVPGATESPSFQLEKVENAPAVSETDNKFTLLQGKETCIEKKKNKKAATPQKSPACAESNKKFKFFCEPCQVGAYSMKVMNAHKKGKRHLSKVANINKAEDAASVKKPAPKGAAEENKDNNKEVDVAGSVENVMVEVKEELDIAAVKEINNEIEGELVESCKENVDCDVDEKKELDIAAVEELKFEVEEEQVESSNENISCNGAGVDQGKHKVLEVVYW
ncbi:zinc finger protein 407-like [Chenopodium quinoa]|uniref:U1-type domain-containing protein n=1 Tax=Chenopodium quinoa TaxID=63459 RepID=A0A803M8U7_CHEQI|nr:zinc finger protein 407-like [Chenopodium quinoa]